MRKLLAVAVALFAALLTVGASPAAAGGWAVTSLDPMTTVPVAGEPTAVGFTIRQHGVTPVALDDVAIVVTDESGTVTRFPAVPGGTVGHYTATIELPASGTHLWVVEQGWFGEQDLGTLDVAGPSTASTGGSGSGRSALTVPLAVVAAALVGAGLFDLGRSSARRRAAT